MPSFSRFSAPFPLPIGGRRRGNRVFTQVLSGLTPAHEFSVLAHELAHELLHQDRTRRGAADRTVRETEAEAVAFVVCRAIGLEPGSQHADYITLYRGTVDTLAASLAAIQEASARILAAVEECGAMPGKSL